MTLREVLDKALHKIGPSFQELIYEDLERLGLCLDCDEFSIEELEKRFCRIFGQDVTSLLMNSIQKHLKNQ